MNAAALPTPGAMPRLAEIQFQNAIGFEAQKRGMYPAYQGTVLLWELGPRAFDGFDGFHPIEPAVCDEPDGT